MYNATSRLSSTEIRSLGSNDTARRREREREMIIVRELGVRMVCDMIMYDLKVYTDDGVRGVFFMFFHHREKKIKTKPTLLM